MAYHAYIATAQNNWAKEKLWTNERNSQTSKMTVKASDKPSESAIEQVW